MSGREISGLADKIIQHYSEYDDLSQLHMSNPIESLNAHKQMGISLVKDYDNSVIPLN